MRESGHERDDRRDDRDGTGGVDVAKQRRTRALILGSVNLSGVARVRDARTKLLDHALSLPGAWLDHPWGEDVAKIGKKVFVFFGINGPELGLGVKLPRSLLFARTQPFVKRFGYGLDASGWVATRFAKGDDVPLQLLREWIEESYEAVAPKKRVAASAKRART